MSEADMPAVSDAPDEAPNTSKVGDIPGLTQDALRQRARNEVWNAAGDYELTPAKLFGTDVAASTSRRNETSDSDLFRNTATGLIAKWFDQAAIDEVYAGWEEDYRASQLNEVCWLCFAQAACAREAPLRPALDELHASWLAQLAEHDPARARLVSRLDCAGLSQDQIVQRVRALQRELYRFDGHVVAAPDTRLHLGVSLAALISRGQDRDERTRYALVGGDQGNFVAIKSHRRGFGALRERGAQARERDARTYIEGCFGPSLLPLDEVQQLEREVCVGAHEGCHLWIADGTELPGGGSGRAFLKMRADARVQQERNESFYETNRLALDAAAERFARTIGDAVHGDAHLLEHRRPEGRLEGGKAWRCDMLNDAKVFSHRVRLERPDVSVEIALDASGSRADDQERIAAQAYVISKGLARCGIAVRMGSFCSVRGYTVLRLLSDMRDASSAVNAFRFAAGGMNRDGLALRALEKFALQRPAARHVLLILTDAAPMDDVGSGSSAANKEGYIGKPAVEDTASAVRELERDGVVTAAIFDGEDEHVASAQKIYGHDFVRIRSIERMAQAAAQLMVGVLTR